jgi:hypothetical protein
MMTFLEVLLTLLGTVCAIAQGELGMCAVVGGIGLLLLIRKAIKS